MATTGETTMTEQMYTTDTAVERLTREVAEAVESGGRFSRAEFSVDDVATVIEAAVQQPNRDEPIRAIRVPVKWQGEKVVGWLLDEEDAALAADAILAALPIPATDEGWKKVSPGFATTREAYEWLASRKPEAAPPDTDHAQHREAEECVAGCPVCEANEELRLRMNAETARSRTSQPVQVEVTEEAVTTLAKHMANVASDWNHNDCGDDDHPLGHSNWEAYTDDARRALAALGGGDHAE